MEEEFVDKCPTLKYPKCLDCKNKTHTEAEHTRIVKREYMRAYMHRYNEGRVAYRRKEFVPIKLDFEQTDN